MSATLHALGHGEGLMLADGRRVSLRPVQPEDAAGEQAFIRRLSPHSRLLRFHGAVNQLPESVLRAMTSIDRRRHHALVAEAVAHDGHPMLVADARYALVDGDCNSAEFAIAVADDWRRIGLGRALLERLARHARRRGITRLEGSVLAGNEPMLALMRELGAVLDDDGIDASVVTARLGFGVGARGQSLPAGLPLLQGV